MAFIKSLDIKNKQILFLFLLFAILYLWRPFFLGYYADDWSLILENKFFLNGGESFSTNSLNYYFSQLGNRPLTAITYFVIYSICGVSNPVAWHFFATFLFLTSVITFRMAIKELFRFLGYSQNSIIEELPTALYVVAPWILSINTWLSVSMSQPTMIFFYLYIFTVFKGYINEQNNYLISFAFLLICLLYYESFYFQWLIVISILFVFRSLKNIELKSLGIHFLLATFSQLIAILWNRYSIYFFDNLVVKTTNPYTIQTFIANIISLPYALISSFLLGSIIIIPVIIYLVLRTKNALSVDINKKIFWKVFVIIIVGILLSVLIFSSAGYSVWGLGMRSRTMITTNFYFIVILSLLFTIPFYRFAINRKLIIILSALTIAIFSIYSFCNSLDWVYAWEIQKYQLSNLPNNRINQTDPKSIILLSDDFTFKHNWVSVFDAQWAINFQMNYGNMVIKGQQDTACMEHQNRRFSIGKNIIHSVNHRYYVNELRGDSLYQYYQNNNIESITGQFYTREFAYKTSGISILYANEPFLKSFSNDTIIKFNPIKNYDYWLTYIYNKTVTKNI